jgi:hypothetical protein
MRFFMKKLVDSFFVSKGNLTLNSNQGAKIKKKSEIWFDLLQNPLSSDIGLRIVKQYVLAAP